MDFDGTLVDFAIDPASVQLPESRRVLLKALAARSDYTVGLVSGRRIGDLRDRSGNLAGAYYAGLHGLEIEGPGLKFTHAGLAVATPTIGVLSKELRRAVRGLDGVVIEDKGLSVVLHTRGASKSDSLHAKTRFLALSEPYLNEGLLRIQPGDEMAELLPNVDWTKGDAVRCVLKHVEAQSGEPVWPLYIGDDATDEEAFEAIGESGLTIAVSNRTAGAAFRVPDPAAIEAFLAAVAATD
jgi:trehalose-phosphatase